MHFVLAEYFRRFKEVDLELPAQAVFFTDFGPDFELELPYLYLIEAACNRLSQALQHQEKVCIYSDYDTDAVTATATMYWGLRYFGFKPENLDFYAPDRFTEGYGMNPEAATRLAQKYDLIISVDCGINSVDEARVIQSSQVTEEQRQIAGKYQAGCDLIITDHHHLTGELPSCVAVINPRLQHYFYGSHPQHVVRKQYLSESVTGVGVSWFTVLWLGYWLQFKADLTAEVGQVPGYNLKELRDLLPFVAIGTIADCQSILESTNRLLVKAGIQLMQHIAHKGSSKISLLGLQNLLRLTGLTDQVQHGYQLVSSDLAFTLSPILNSSGRMSHARLSIQALVGIEARSAEQAAELLATNVKRKQETARILKQVESEAQSQFEAGESLIWVGNSDWSKGLIGLLASRLVSKYNLPVVVLELPLSLESNQAVVGESAAIPAVASLRAPEGYNLPEAMHQIRELFLKCGGHPGAAGFSAEQSNLEQIKTGLSSILRGQAQHSTHQVGTDYSQGRRPTAAEHSDPDRDLVQSVVLDTVLPLEQWAWKKNSIWLDPDTLQDEDFWNDIGHLEPHGIDFPSPVLVFQTPIASVQTMSDGKHVKIISTVTSNGQPLVILNFNIAAELKHRLIQIAPGSIVWVVGRASRNAWKNKLSWQIIAEEILIN